MGVLRRKLLSYILLTYSPRGSGNDHNILKRALVMLEMGLEKLSLSQIKKLQILRRNFPFEL
jgi:hypothetical protein